MTDQTIWKQTLEMQTTQIVRLPYGAEILSAQVQHNTLCIWYKFELKHSTAPQRREIHIYGTGHDIIKSRLKHIDTVQMKEGKLVFHVFEALP